MASRARMQWEGRWRPVLKALAAPGSFRERTAGALVEYLQRTYGGRWTPRTERLFWWACRQAGGEDPTPGRGSPRRSGR